nr:uncharacterized protein LOC124493694 [Dermatophagoides farinae]
MRVKFIRFERMLDLLTDIAKDDYFNRNPKIRRLILERNLYQSYHYLNSLMVEYDVYNSIWKWLATFSLFWRFIIINFVSFIAIFYDMPPTFKLMYRSIFISENFAFLMFLLKVGIVHMNMANAAKRLRRFLYHMNSPTLSLKIKTIDYVTFLQEPQRFGQTTITGHLIQFKHVFLIIREFSSYFLLLASISIRLLL